jgi:hypothetical protein
MSLRDEFHLYLDRDWPLWKRHEGGVLYNRLWDAFTAGFRIGDGGPSAQIIDGGKPISAIEAINMPPRKFKPPRPRR